MTHLCWTTDDLLTMASRHFDLAEAHLESGEFRLSYRETCVSFGLLFPLTLTFNNLDYKALVSVEDYERANALHRRGQKLLSHAQAHFTEKA